MAARIETSIAMSDVTKKFILVWFATHICEFQDTTPGMVT